MARTIRASIEADDPEYATSRSRGSVLELSVSSDDSSSARRTVDDLLAAVAIAERVLGVEDPLIRRRPSALDAGQRRTRVSPAHSRLPD